MTVKDRRHAPVNKRQLFGWAMFDVANSAYTTVVITLVYSAFFVGFIVPADSGYGNRYWALAIGISSLLSMVLAPLVGCIADQFGGKKRMLLATMWLCSLATASLYWVEPGAVWLAVWLLVVSNCCWMLGESLCASFLTDISEPRHIGWISGLGWGIGYLGGLASLMLVLFVVITSSPNQFDAYVHDNQLAMVVVAGFFYCRVVANHGVAKRAQTVARPGGDLDTKAYLAAICRNHHVGKTVTGAVAVFVDLHRIQRRYGDGD